MRAVVAYESLFGNTHAVAEAVADGISDLASVDLLDVDAITGTSFRAADLVVFGGPTHKHGLSDRSSRLQAEAWARAHGDSLRLDRDAPGRGLRDLLGEGGWDDRALMAVFDTCMGTDPVVTGSAGRAAARLLARRAGTAVTEPVSFHVSTGNRLLPGELERARAWGSDLAATALRRASDDASRLAAGPAQL
ncbi:flavodoxin [Rathayibacter sp. VKM Ac-2759]|uniref:flavodoxin family protein n=1 Tax=Rathayibacter sp. VKM Ac-2759 TaxID=2609252 RepID=UPI001315C7AA|nr:flavodoxin domain-containing protein [Rathayibacter sp. VKM Ac-2759]QHC66676.1 flavodoxin [Rathayibacter sp. VKM Ac-2759]